MIFPENSTNLIELLKKEYNILATAITLLQDGSDNFVYKIITNNQQSYVLRISKRENKKDDIAFETDVMTFLHCRSLPVPQIIKTIHNQNFCLMNNMPVCLFSFCTGNVFNLSLQNKPTEKMAINGGQALATIHRVLSDYRQQNTFKTVRSTFSEIERVLHQKDYFCQKYLDGETIIDNINQIMTEVEPLVTNDTIIHNDFRIQNLLFNGNEISAILDFDWACVGSSLKDLGHALIEWSFPDGAKTCQWDILKAFLKGYQEIYSQIDIPKLLIWMRFSCLSDACTYLMDTINQKSQPREANSYMHEKYKFFTKTDRNYFISMIV